MGAVTYKTVTFNGISSGDLGLVIQAPPAYTFPEKDYEVVHVPGRNGDVVIDKGSYQNSEREYNFARVLRKNDDFNEIANNIVAWLHSASGYARLEDEYEPNYYRMAMFKDDGSLSSIYDQATAITITFECMPQRWLKSGDEWQSLESDENGLTIALTNPTKQDSKPLLKLKTSTTSDITISINDKNLIVKRHSAEVDLYIDFEQFVCYTDDKLLNNLIKVDSDFPVLKGDTTTTITITGTSEASIKPRWWTL